MCRLMWKWVIDMGKWTGPVGEYRRQVLQGLNNAGFSRFRLGRELEQKLEALLEEVPSPSEQDLMEAFGPAEEMTELLMRRVPQWQQRLWMRLKRSAVAALVVAVAVILLLALAVFWIKENPL